MKLIFTTIALLVMLFYTVGYFFTFHFEQEKIREEIVRQIHSNDFIEESVTLYFLPDEFKALKINSREFYFKGHMFDIIKQESCNGFLAVTCLQDEKESSLLTSLRNFFTGKNNSSKEHNGSAQTLLSFLQMPFIKSCCEASANPESVYQLFRHISFIYQSPVSQVINPPPEYL